MALTFEQFKQLKAKGLTTEQIAKFENGYKPEKTGFIENIKSDLSKRGEEIKKSLTASKSPIEMIRKSLNIAGQAAGGVLDVANRAGQTIFDKGTTELSKHISGTPTKLEQKINKTGVDILQSQAGQVALNAIKNGVDAYNEFKKQHPEIAKDIENVINIAAVLPVGKVLSSATKQTAKQAVSLTKKAVNTTLKAGEPIIAKTGDVLDTAGKKLVKAAIPLSDQEAGMVQAYKAKNTLVKRISGQAGPEPRTAAITAYDKGFAGTESMIGVQAKREAESLWKNTVKPALQNIKEKIETSDVINNVLNRIIKDIKAPGRQNELVDALEAMADDYKGITTMTHEFAQDIKSDLYKHIPEKMWKGKPIASSYREVQSMFAQELRNLTRAKLKGDVEALSAFDDYGNLKALMEFGKKAMTGSKFKGGAGSWLNAAKEKLLVPIETIGGQILKKGGRMLRK